MLTPPSPQGVARRVRGAAAGGINGGGLPDAIEDP